LSAEKPIGDMAANGSGNPSVFDPLAGYPNHPYFNRDLLFTSAKDMVGRTKLAAISHHPSCKHNHC